MDAILELRAFGIALGERTILRTLDLDIPARGVTVILGPSGTGKSTLLRTLAGMNAGNPGIRLRGEARYRGAVLDDEAARPALVVQKVTQMVSIVLESLLSNLPDRSRLTRPEQLAVLEAHTRELGQEWLMARLAQPVVQLSYPEQRRLSIVRETLSDPGLLMLDEPTANMDDAAADGMLALIARVAETRPVLMISHHLGHTRRLADRVLLLASGRVQEAANTAEFFGNPRTEAARTYLRTGSCPEESREEESRELPEEPVPTVDTLTTALPVQPEPAPETATPGLTLPSRPAGLRPRATVGSRFRAPRGFSWLVPGCVAGTPWPGIIRPAGEDLEDLRAVGIHHLLSLTENPYPAGLAAEYGLGMSHFPIPDMHAPDTETALRICRELDRLVQGDQAVAVHCKAGLGRTGTVLALYWLWIHPDSCSAGDAIRHVRGLNAAMIQSREQEDFIHEFKALLAMAAAS